MSHVAALVAHLYVVIALLCACIGALGLFGDQTDQRIGARFILFASVWPVAAAWVVFANAGRWIKQLIELADLGGKP